MAKLAIFACVLFLAYTSQAFTLSGLDPSAGKTDLESLSTNVLARSKKSVESEGADSSVSEDSDESDESDEDVDAADSPVSEETGDGNNGRIRNRLQKMITFLRNLFQPINSDSSKDNEVSDNSETQVVDDEESSEDTENEVIVVNVADLEESSNPDLLVDSKVSDDEVPQAAESLSSKDSEASEVLENLDETSN